MGGEGRGGEGRRERRPSGLPLHIISGYATVIKNMGEPNKPGSAGATLFGVADPKIHSSTYVLLRRIWSMHIPQNWGAGPHHMTLKSTRLPNMCYHTHFDHSRSNCVGRVSKIFGCTGATPPFGWVRG